MGVTGKLSASARKGFAAVVAVAAIVFACFTGLAYVMDTIASWNSPLVPVQFAGFALTGGMALGALVLTLAGALDDAAKGSFKTVALAVVAAGVVLAVVAFCAHVMGVSGFVERPGKRCRPGVRGHVVCGAGRRFCWRRPAWRPSLRCAA